MPTTGEFCTRRIAFARRGEPIIDAARRMRDEHVGCLVVVDETDGRRVPVGMLTDRDLVVGVLARTDRHVDAVTVGDVMTSDVVRAREDDDLAYTCKRMRAAGVRRMPVVDDGGALAGLVAFDDVMEWLQEQLAELVQLLSRERKQERERRP